MSNRREIRADFDRSTIVVYQALNETIADAALAAGRFVSPFSVDRMTWIKPSFLWLMERSDWGTKRNQERILGVRITRAGWDRALRESVLTSFDSAVHGTIDRWRDEFSHAVVHVQWDPERSIYGKKLNHRSIQVGLSRAIIDDYVTTWVREITDLTPRVAKMRQLRKTGNYDQAKRMLPAERSYPASADMARRLGIGV